MSRLQWKELEAKIEEYGRAANQTKELVAMDAEVMELEKRILALSKQRKSLPLQLKLDRVGLEALLNSIPEKLKKLDVRIADLREKLKQLAITERELLPLETEILTLQQLRTSLSAREQENRKLTAASSELTIATKAKAGNSSVSSNHPKLIFAVFALSMLAFVGLVAVRDMPGAIAAANTAGPLAPTNGHPNGSMQSGNSNLPVPAWNNPPASSALAMRSATINETNEHLRALAARIAQNATDRGSIVLFTPASSGLRIESLVGDLGCYYAQHGGRVLVFDARPLEGSSSLPAWAGPAAGEVGIEVEDFILGHLDRPSACCVSTLIASIDYSRCDVFKHLGGVLSMYRFRRLVEEMKSSYSLILLITPEMYRRDPEDDFLGHLAEGVVVVMSDGVNPAEVDAYIHSLRALDRTVYGAVTVPRGV